MAPACGLVMLTQFLCIEYSNLEDVIVSMGEIFDQFIDIIFAVPVSKLELYEIVLERMRPFLTSDSQPSLSQFYDWMAGRLCHFSS